MFGRLGRYAATRPWVVCALWVALGLALTWAAPSWDARAQDDDVNFLPARCPGVRGYRLLQEAFPRDVFACRAVFAVERADAPLTPEDFDLVGHLAEDLQRLRDAEPALHLGQVTSFKDPVLGDRLTSRDRHCTLVQLSLGTPYLALQTRQAVDRAEEVLRRRLEEAGPAAPRLYTTGAAGIGRDLVQASGDSLDATTLATVALVVVVLLFVYRAPLLALVPLVTIAASTWVALQALALVTTIPGVYLVSVSKVFAIVILYGAGTDYCLFLISRYREELGHGQPGPDAVRRSVSAVGGALAASAGTVICGLGLMGCAEFAKVRCAGPAIALSLAVALAAALTLTPALLRLLGGAAFWPGKPPAFAGLRLHDAEGERPGGFWEWVSHGVLARPVLVWTTAVLVLLPLTVLGLRVVPNYRATGELHPSSDSVQGLAALQRHFTAGETGPVTILLEGATPWDSPEGRQVLASASRALSYLDNVAEVRSLARPLGEPVPDPVPVAEPSGPGLLNGLAKWARVDVAAVLREQADRKAREHYVATVRRDDGPRSVTRLDVVLHSDPFDAPSAVTLTTLQTWLDRELPRHGGALGAIRAECYGVTVNARDLAEVTESDRGRVNALVLGGILLILLVVVRKAWLAAYLLATVLLSYYATLGAAALFGTWWLDRPLGQVDWRVPFFLFTILVAVGEDYNILLIDRALHERKRHGAAEGMRRALARTGGTITSCGLIMAGTFATLMLGGLGTLVQIGFALAFGVLLDTFLIRPFVVPAFTLLVWRREEESGQTGPQPGHAPNGRLAA